MRIWIVSILIGILLLSACSKPVGLNGEKNTTAKNVTITKNETVEKNTTKAPKPAKNTTKTTQPEPKEDSLVGADDRIDITTKDKKGSVKGTVKGVTKEFTTEYDDVDAIVFDAAKLFKITLYEARYIAYVNGNRLLKPSQLGTTTEEISQQEDPKLDTSYIPLVTTWEEGFLRGVGCDRKKGIIVMSIHNNMSTKTPLWRDVRPRIKGAIVFRLNRIVLDGVYCAGADPLEPWTTYLCQRSGVNFLEDKHFSVTENKTYESFQNEVAVSVPGETEVKYFNCPETLTPVKPATNSTVSTNSTSNSTNSTG